MEQVSISKEVGVRVEDVLVEEEDKGPLRGANWPEEEVLNDINAVGSFGITFTNLGTKKHFMKKLEGILNHELTPQFLTDTN